MMFTAVSLYYEFHDNDCCDKAKDITAKCRTRSPVGQSLTVPVTESKSLYMQPFDDSEVKSICLVSIKIATVINSFCLSYASYRARSASLSRNEQDEWGT